MPATPTTDRLPPHSLETEQGVLGCIFQGPQDAIPECLRVLTMGSTAFYDLRHADIYDVMLQLYDERAPIDVITVRQRLQDTNQLESVGGTAYVSEISGMGSGPANIGYYLGILAEQFTLRTILRSCTEVASRIYEHEGQAEGLLDEIEKTLAAMNRDRSEDCHTAKEVMRAAVAKAEEYHQSQGNLIGVGTGFSDLDSMTMGLHPGEVTIIAARPSMGKTALAMNIAEHAAVELKLPVGVFSLEMTAESLGLRLLCSRARVNLREMRKGYLVERDFPKMTGAAVQISASPLFIDDSSGISILQLRAKARRMHHQHHIKLFVIDYLQMLHSTSRRADNRQQEIADISGGVKALAKELKVPILLLSQLNRELEKDKNRKPRLSDLRESGTIEQDADTVALLYKPHSDEEDGTNHGDALAVNLLIAKQRNGPTGEVNLTFLKSITRFEQAARANQIDAEDMPHRKDFD